MKSYPHSLCCKQAITDCQSAFLVLFPQKKDFLTQRLRSLLLQLMFIFCQCCFDSLCCSRVARFFRVQHTKMGKNISNYNKVGILNVYKIYDVPNDRKIYVPNGHKICQHLPLQYPPKVTKIRTFWFENMSSGNPVLLNIG
jgi:hypothetical protein